MSTPLMFSQPAPYSALICSPVTHVCLLLEQIFHHPDYGFKCRKLPLSAYSGIVRNLINLTDKLDMRLCKLVKLLHR